ncbi:MAG TPA: hypothetical protein ENJ27_01660 [Candidatus Moranbacteria bacterium]|nr:hypothetical protein [Candidatus Moranbacteria bacterium]
MAKEITEYRKKYTRFYPLIAYECWYYAERFGLLEIGIKRVFFETLFIYKENEGTSVYYDFTDLKQWPLPIVWYFDEHLEEFKKIIADFKKDYETLKKIKVNTDISAQEKLKKIYSIYKKLMPVVTITILIGDNKKEIKNHNLSKISYEARKSTEDFIFYTTESIIESIIKIVPKKYGQYLYFLTYDEVLGKLPDISTLKKRQQEYFFYKGKIITELEKEIFAKKNNLKIIDEKISSFKKRSFKGNIACPGKSIGKIKKITSIETMSKIKKDEILVTSMTTPDLMAVSKNFSAIITDEGGITCHAAIVSRELGIPCIIGTKIATQVLHDGDLVEVDADDGVVRILKKIDEK